MTSQIVANIDSDLKKTAMSMAKENGITLKSLITLLLKSYVDKEITFGLRLRRDYGNLSLEKEVEDININTDLQKKFNNLSTLL